MTRTKQINRLADALTHYREHKPADDRQQMLHIRKTAIRFGIGLKLMNTAISMMSGGIDCPETRKRRTQR